LPIVKAVGSRFSETGDICSKMPMRWLLVESTMNKGEPGWRTQSSEMCGVPGLEPGGGSENVAGSPSPFFNRSFVDDVRRKKEEKIRYDTKIR
jgi:hypothetical protein